MTTRHSGLGSFSCAAGGQQVIQHPPVDVTCTSEARSRLVRPCRATAATGPIARGASLVATALAVACVHAVIYLAADLPPGLFSIFAGVLGGISVCHRRHPRPRRPARSAVRSTGPCAICCGWPGMIGTVAAVANYG